MFYMPQGARHELGRALGLENGGVVAYQDIPRIVVDAYKATRSKVEGIGLNVPQYYGAWQAFRDMDMDRIRELTGISRKRMQEARGKWTSTKDLHKNPLTGDYKPERRYYHHELVREKLAGLTPEANPQLIFLVGTPGTGKTSLRTEETGHTKFTGDEVKFSNFAVTDPDALRPDVMPGFDARLGQHVYETQEEVFDVSTAITDEALRRRLNIVSETTLRNTDWVLETIAAAKGYQSKVILIHTPLEECFRRTIAWRARAASIDFLLSAMQGYENFFNLSNLDLVDEAVVLESDATNPIRREVYRKKKGEAILSDEARVAAIQEYGRAFKQVALYQ